MVTLSYCRRKLCSLHGRELKLLNETEMMFFAIGPTDVPAELEGTYTDSKGVLRFNVIGGQGVPSFERAYQVFESNADLIVMAMIESK